MFEPDQPLTTAQAEMLNSLFALCSVSKDEHVRQAAAVLDSRFEDESKRGAQVATPAQRSLWAAIKRWFRGKP